MTPEGKVKAQMLKLLKQRNAWVLPTLAGTAKKGVPDVLICYGGYFIGLEIKRPKGGKITRIQKLNLDHITQQGGLGVCASSVEFLQRVLDQIDQNKSLVSLGYRTHTFDDIQNDQWLEECVW